MPLKAKASVASTDHDSVTVKFRIFGEFGAHKLYLTMAWGADGKPTSVHVVIDKGGSTTRGFVNAWCELVNHSLARGVSVTEIIAMFKGTRFEPSGMVEPAEYGSCASVLDLIVCAMEKRFVKSR